jgi:hypothetical protein
MKYWFRLVIFLKNISFQKKQRYFLKGDVSGSSFDTIKAHLSGMNFHVFNSTAQGYRVRFWDDYSEYVLSFTSGGKVIQIELEHWKPEGVKFQRLHH